MGANEGNHRGQWGTDDAREVPKAPREAGAAGHQRKTRPLALRAGAFSQRGGMRCVLAPPDTIVLSRARYIRAPRRIGSRQRRSRPPRWNAGPAAIRPVALAP